MPKHSEKAQNAPKTGPSADVSLGGHLTPHTRGIVFGMHLHSAPATEIADRLGMTPTGVESPITISQGMVAGGRDEKTPRGDTTPSPKKKDIQQVLGAKNNVLTQILTSFPMRGPPSKMDVSLRTSYLQEESQKEGLCKSVWITK
jgi:hypothetical protein